MANVTIMGADYQNVNEIYLKDADTGDELKFVLEVVPTTMIIIPEQTLSVSSAYTPIPNVVEALIEGETYIYTVNGASGQGTAKSQYGSIGFYVSNDILFENAGGTMYFDVMDSSLYGSYTIKVEKVLSS